MGLTGSVLTISGANSPIDLAPLLGSGGGFWLPVAGSDDIYNTNQTGQIGIHTNAPGYPLDIYGSTRIKSPDQSKPNLVLFQETASQYSVINFNTSGSTFKWNLQGRGAGNNSEFDLTLDGGAALKGDRSKFSG